MGATTAKSRCWAAMKTQPRRDPEYTEAPTDLQLQRSQGNHLKHGCNRRKNRERLVILAGKLLKWYLMVFLLDNKGRQGKTQRKPGLEPEPNSLWRNTVGLWHKNHRILRGKANLVKKVYYEATWKVQTSVVSKGLHCSGRDVHTGPETIQARRGNGNAQETVWDKTTSTMANENCICMTT